VRKNRYAQSSDDVYEEMVEIVEASVSAGVDGADSGSGSGPRSHVRYGSAMYLTRATAYWKVATVHEKRATNASRSILAPEVVGQASGLRSSELCTVELQYCQRGS
jgi:hypothetical protein